MSRRGAQKKVANGVAAIARSSASAEPSPPPSPLAAFWELLDLRAKASILQVRCSALKCIHLCANCTRLLKAAWTSNTSDLDNVHDAYDIPWGYTLMRLQDGSYVTEDTRTTLSPQKVLEFAITPYPELQADRCFQYRGPYDGEVFRYACRIPEVPSNACWYCYDKLYVRFVDMLTYPRPPRRFTMLLCKDDRVRALKQVLAAEVGLDSPSRLVLQLQSKPLDDDNASMVSLGVTNGQLVIITKRPTPARPLSHARDAAAEEGDDFSSSSVSSAEDESGSRRNDGALEESALSAVKSGDDASLSRPERPGQHASLGDLVQSCALSVAAVAVTASHRYDAEGSDDEGPLTAAAATVATSGAGTSTADTSKALMMSSEARNSVKRAKGGHKLLKLRPLSDFDDDDELSLADGAAQQNKRFVAELLLGATGYSGRGGGRRSGAVTDKFAGLPTNEAPPVSPRGPVASVDRRHGYSVLGCMLSHLLHVGISAAWEADVSALRAQEELIAECESERRVRRRGRVSEGDCVLVSGTVSSSLSIRHRCLDPPLTSQKKESKASKKSKGKGAAAKAAPLPPLPPPPPPPPSVLAAGSSAPSSFDLHSESMQPTSVVATGSVSSPLSAAIEASRIPDERLSSDTFDESSVRKAGTSAVKARSTPAAGAQKQQPASKAPLSSAVSEPGAKASAAGVQSGVGAAASAASLSAVDLPAVPGARKAVCGTGSPHETQSVGTHSAVVTSSKASIPVHHGASSSVQVVSSRSSRTQEPRSNPPKLPTSSVALQPAVPVPSPSAAPPVPVGKLAQQQQQQQQRAAVIGASSKTPQQVSARAAPSGAGDASNVVKGAVKPPVHAGVSSALPQATAATLSADSLRSQPQSRGSAGPVLAGHSHATSSSAVPAARAAPVSAVQSNPSVPAPVLSAATAAGTHAARLLASAVKGSPATSDRVLIAASSSTSAPSLKTSRDSALSLESLEMKRETAADESEVRAPSDRGAAADLRTATSAPLAQHLSGGEVQAGSVAAVRSDTQRSVLFPASDRGALLPQTTTLQPAPAASSSNASAAVTVEAAISSMLKSDATDAPPAELLHLLQHLLTVDRPAMHGSAPTAEQLQLLVRAAAPPGPETGIDVKHEAPSSVSLGSLACPSCQCRVAPTARFCSECGVKLSSALPAAVASIHSQQPQQRPLFHPLPASTAAEATVSAPPPPPPPSNGLLFGSTAGAGAVPLSAGSSIVWGPPDAAPLPRAHLGVTSSGPQDSASDASALLSLNPAAVPFIQQQQQQQQRQHVLSVQQPLYPAQAGSHHHDLRQQHQMMAAFYAPPPTSSTAAVAGGTSFPLGSASGGWVLSAPGGAPSVLLAGPGFAAAAPQHHSYLQQHVHAPLHAPSSVAAQSHAVPHHQQLASAHFLHGQEHLRSPSSDTTTFAFPPQVHRAATSSLAYQTTSTHHAVSTGATGMTSEQAMGAGAFTGRLPVFAHLDAFSETPGS
jgi:hypothetical protein